MATTLNSYTKSNSNGPSFTFTFPYITQTDVKVSVDDVVKTEDTHYEFDTATSIRFLTGNIPATGAVIKIYRDTDIDSGPRNNFYTGSFISASSINDNFEQVVFRQQELDNVDLTGPTGPQGPTGPTVLLVQQVRLVRLVQMVQMEQPARLVLKVLKDLKVQPVPRGILEPKVLKVPLVHRVQLVLRDLKVLLVQQAQQVLKALKALKAKQVLKVLLEPLATSLRTALVLLHVMSIQN